MNGILSRFDLTEPNGLTLIPDLSGLENELEALVDNTTFNENGLRIDVLNDIEDLRPVMKDGKLRSFALEGGIAYLRRYLGGRRSFSSSRFSLSNLLRANEPILTYYVRAIRDKSYIPQRNPLRIMTEKSFEDNLDFINALGGELGEKLNQEKIVEQVSYRANEMLDYLRRDTKSTPEQKEEKLRLLMESVDNALRNISKDFLQTDLIKEVIALKETLRRGKLAEEVIRLESRIEPEGGKSFEGENPLKYFVDYNPYQAAILKLRKIETAAAEDAKSTAQGIIPQAKGVYVLSDGKTIITRQQFVEKYKEANSDVSRASIDPGILFDYIVKYDINENVRNMLLFMIGSEPYSKSTVRQFTLESVGLETESLSVEGRLVLRQRAIRPLEALTRLLDKGVVRSSESLPARAAIMRTIDVEILGIQSSRAVNITGTEVDQKTLNNIATAQIQRTVDVLNSAVNVLNASRTGIITPEDKEVARVMLEKINNGEFSLDNLNISASALQRREYEQKLEKVKNQIEDALAINEQRITGRVNVEAIKQLRQRRADEEKQRRKDAGESSAFSMLKSVGRSLFGKE